MIKRTKRNELAKAIDNLNNLGKEFKSGVTIVFSKHLAEFKRLHPHYIVMLEYTVHKHTCYVFYYNTWRNAGQVMPDGEF